MRQKLNRIVTAVALAFILMFATTDAYSQCAMCRATVESNVGTGSDASGNEVGSGLNMGILYLMVVPYLLIGTVGFLWYKNSRKNANKA
ncbi:hypothetical protein [Pontibacter flavimaris]|uniref:Uncharacterized protein n=1 Tax=Pontibacter flavimaris TaxID=1797110 RepID=A0A1Q5PB93_9BACT|nr:hypothetical protein [Pontibacter flavimaris]OKL39474.1 hypothetical protein A3841_02630 [Pontibacter flavimaris]